MAAVQGCHSVLRHPKLRVFWWKNFPATEEVPWDTFWGVFPKNIPSYAPVLCSALQSSEGCRQTGPACGMPLVGRQASSYMPGTWHDWASRHGWSSWGLARCSPVQHDSLQATACPLQGPRGAVVLKPGSVHSAQL